MTTIPITADTAQDFRPCTDCGAPIYRPASMGVPHGTLRCPPCGFVNADAVCALLRDAQQMIDEDRAKGIVPPTARTWEALHDYVDANEYLPNSATPAECAAVAERITRWLSR
jgi:predicted RNA-binding Zn-ribbon protein involved in translation (DUF1610 family)